MKKMITLCLVFYSMCASAQYTLYRVTPNDPYDDSTYINPERRDTLFRKLWDGSWQVVQQLNYTQYYPWWAINGHDNTIESLDITDVYTKTDIDGFLSAKLNLSDTADMMAGAARYVNNTSVLTAIGFSPYPASNPSGFITSASITGKLNISDTASMLSGYMRNGTSYSPTTYSVTRPVNGTTFTPSSTKPSFLKYNIKITCTASIGSASSGKVTLQYSTDGGSNWTTAGEVENSNTVTLAITLNSVTTQSGFITANVPANALCKLVSTSSGTTSISYLMGQETY